MAKAPRKRASYADGPLVSSGTPSTKAGTEPQGKTEANGTASQCLKEIRAYEKKFERWTDRGKRITERYRDERDNATIGFDRPSRNMNIFWSNVQILKPTLYAREPKSEIVRRFRDRDPAGRTAAECIERATDFEIENTGLHDVLEKCVEDRLLPGRGQAWVSYDPQLASNDNVTEKTGDALRVDYLHWRDFGHSAVPIWKRVTKVWRWKYFSRTEFIDRFGDKHVEKVEFSKSYDTKANENEKEPTAMARVAEVWDKKRKKVYWVSKSVEDYLDEYDAPLTLQHFFPCPPPLYATMTTDSLVPVPDFYLYQDQANEIDKLTARINNLTSALKVAGAYDEDFKDLETLFDPAGAPDNLLVPVKMSDLTGKGGINNAVQLVDISQVVATLQACYESRRQAIQAIYEITGISDVIRGATDPNETARAQEIKSQFGGTRIRDMQQAVASFSRSIIRIMAEIIAENYEPMALWEMTYAESYVGTITTQNPLTGQSIQQPNVQVFADAVRLLRNDKLRTFRVSIETDSTIALDEQEEQSAANEFITAVGGFLSNSTQLVSAAPETLPMVGETLMFLARRYKAGRTLENSIEQTVEALQRKAQQPPQPSVEQQEIQLKQQELAQDGQAKAKELQLKEGELSLKARELAMKEAEILRDAGQTVSPEKMQELAIKYEAMIREDARERDKMFITAETDLAKAAISADASRTLN